jgi:hypothetical protein
MRAVKKFCGLCRSFSVWARVAGFPESSDNSGAGRRHPSPPQVFRLVLLSFSAPVIRCRVLSRSGYCGPHGFGIK